MRPFVIVGSRDWRHDTFQALAFDHDSSSLVPILLLKMRLRHLGRSRKQVRNTARVPQQQVLLLDVHHWALLDNWNGALRNILGCLADRDKVRQLVRLSEDVVQVSRVTNLVLHVDAAKLL